MKLSSKTIPAHDARIGFWLLMLAISVLALMPGPPGLPDLIGVDKISHLSAYAALTLLARLGWPLLGRATLFILLMIHGGLIELGQGLPVIGRTSSLADMVANGLGIGLGLGLSWILARLFGRTDT